MNIDPRNTLDEQLRQADRALDARLAIDGTAQSITPANAASARSSIRAGKEAPRTRVNPGSVLQVMTVCGTDGAGADSFGPTLKTKLGRSTFEHYGASGMPMYAGLLSIANNPSWQADNMAGNIRCLLIGSPEVRQYGAGQEEVFRRWLRAFVVLSQTSRQDIANARESDAYSYTGNWSTAGYLSGVRFAQEVGGTISYTTNGSVVYVVLGVSTDGRETRARIAIDGAVVHDGLLISERTPVTPHPLIGQCLRFDLGTDKARVVTVTALTVDSAEEGGVYVFAIGSNRPGREHRGKPLLVLGTIPPFQNLSEISADYSDVVREVAEESAGDGLNVRPADVHAALGASDMSTDIHPTAGGTTKIAEVFYRAITG